MAKSASAIRAGQAFVEVFDDHDPLARGLKQSEALLRRFGSRVNALGRSLIMAGAKLAAPYVIAGRAFAQFEFLMRRTQILSGAVGKSFDALKSKAELLGRTTIFTAKDTAAAMNFFALAGYNAKQIYDVITPTLDLAAAGILNVADAANITAGVLAAMQIAASNSGHAIDVLTKGMTGAKTNLAQLGDAFAYVGPVAHTAGQSIEEITAAIQVLSNANVAGTLAGTTLRGAIIRLAAPTKAAQKILDELGVTINDAAGNMLPFSEIVSQLEAGLKHLGTGERLARIGKLFPLRQASGMAALIAQGGAELKRRVVDLQNATGTAARIAREQIDTLKGDFIIMISALTGLAIDLGEVISGTVRKWLQFVTDFSNIVSEFVKRNKEMFIVGVKLSAALIAIGGGLLALAASMKVVAFAFGPMIAATKLFGLVVLPVAFGAKLLLKSMSLLLAPFRLIRTPIALTIAGLTTLGLVFKRILLLPLVFAKRIVRLIGVKKVLAKNVRALWRALKLLVSLPFKPITLAMKAFHAVAPVISGVVLALRVSLAPIKATATLMRILASTLELAQLALIGFAGALTLVGAVLGVVGGIAIFRFLTGLVQSVIASGKLAVALGRDVVRAAQRAATGFDTFARAVVAASKSVYGGMRRIFASVAAYGMMAYKIMRGSYSLVVELLKQGKIEDAFDLIWLNLKFIALSGVNTLSNIWNDIVEGAGKAIPKLIFAFRLGWNFLTYLAKSAFEDVLYSMRKFIIDLQLAWAPFVSSLADIFNLVPGFGDTSTKLAKIAASWGDVSERISSATKDLRQLEFERRNLVWAGEYTYGDKYEGMLKAKDAQIAAKRAEIAFWQNFDPYSAAAGQRQRNQKRIREEFDANFAAITKDAQAFDPVFTAEFFGNIKDGIGAFGKVLKDGLNGILSINAGAVDKFLESWKTGVYDLGDLGKQIAKTQASLSVGVLSQGLGSALHFRRFSSAIKKGLIAPTRANLQAQIDSVARQTTIRQLFHGRMSAADRARLRDLRREEAAYQRGLHGGTGGVTNAVVGAAQNAAAAMSSAIRSAFVISHPLQFVGAESGGAVEQLKDLNGTASGILDILQQAEQDWGTFQ